MVATSFFHRATAPAALWKQTKTRHDPLCALNHYAAAAAAAAAALVLQMLSDISHLVIDEVHERDVLSDFLLAILRPLLARRPDLRVILMRFVHAIACAVVGNEQ